MGVKIGLYLLFTLFIHGDHLWIGAATFAGLDYPKWTVGVSISGKLSMPCGAPSA
jgi:hypothetical protein